MSFLVKKYCIKEWLEESNPINSFLENPEIFMNIMSHHNLRDKLISRDWKTLPFEKTPDFFFKSHKEYFHMIYESNLSFVIKVHPDHLSAKNWSGEIFDINDMKLDNFDRIYFSQRNNISDFVCSYYIADSTNKWIIYENDIRPKINLTEIPLIPMDEIISIYIWNTFIIDHIKDYLEKKKILYQTLEYLEIPNWIEENSTYEITKLMEHPNTQFLKKFSKIPSNIVYKEKITNYDNIINRYNDTKDNLINLFYAQNPKLNRIKY
jgi:hypothetical protein